MNEGEPAAVNEGVSWVTQVTLTAGSSWDKIDAHITPLSMQKHYTIKEAAAFTGKSQSTIKRLIAPIREDDSSVDRQQLLPSPEQYADLKKSGQPFNWQISEAFLRQHFPVVESNDAKQGAESSITPDQMKGITSDKLVEALTKTIDILENQLNEKDRQIKEKDELVNKFGGMAQDLQKKLLLAPVTSATPPTAPPRQPTNLEQGIDAEVVSPPPRRKKQVRRTAKRSFADRHLPTFKRMLQH